MSTLDDDSQDALTDAYLIDRAEHDAHADGNAPDEDEEICGETYDHEMITYDGPDGTGWECRRCGAEGWEPKDDDPPPVP